MRFVLALFDAPLPARNALADLARAGFAAADVVVLPPVMIETPLGLAAIGDPDSLPEPGFDHLPFVDDRHVAADRSFADDRIGAEAQTHAEFGAHANDRQLERDLVALGLPGAEAAGYAEGVHRGAILVVVRAPTLSAPVAAALLNGAGSADLAAEAARWQVDRTWRYYWAQSPPLTLDDTAPSPLDDTAPSISE